MIEASLGLTSGNQQVGLHSKWVPLQNVGAMHFSYPQHPQLNIHASFDLNSLRKENAVVVCPPSLVPFIHGRNPITR